MLRVLTIAALGISSIFAQEPTPAVNVIPENDTHMTEYEESLRKKAELTGHVITPEEEKSMQDYKETVEKHKLEAKRRRELHDRFLKEQKKNAEKAAASGTEGGPSLKPPMLDPWLVLGLPRDATSEDVEQAFQSMKAMGGREGNSPAVHMSYHVLIDPSMRARMLSGEMELPDPDPSNTHSHHFVGDNFHDRPELDPTRLEL
jgi:hypothetical protein